MSEVCALEWMVKRFHVDRLDLYLESRCDQRDKRIDICYADVIIGKCSLLSKICFFFLLIYNFKVVKIILIVFLEYSLYFVYNCTRVGNVIKFKYYLHFYLDLY